MDQGLWLAVTDVLTTCRLPCHRFSKCQSLHKRSSNEEYAHQWPDDHVFKCIILFFFLSHTSNKDFLASLMDKVTLWLTLFMSIIWFKLMF